jgi:Rrf2 family protein
MYLSTRGRYATRAMLELAQHYAEAPLSTAAISQSQGISERYLQQLLGTLKRAGLVRVVMGPGGGYTLAGPPTGIRLSAILDAVEGRLALVECVRKQSYCPRAPECLSRGVWLEASELLNRYYSSLTLADVLMKCRKGNLKRWGARPPEILPSPRRRRPRKTK